MSFGGVAGSPIINSASSDVTRAHGSNWPSTRETGSTGVGVGSDSLVGSGSIIGGEVSTGLLVGSGAFGSRTLVKLQPSNILSNGKYASLISLHRGKAESFPLLYFSIHSPGK
jgi:hypothetical protein